MQLPIVVFVLIVEFCLAGFVIETSRGNRSSHLIEAVVTTLKSCYGNRTNVVSLAGDLDEILINTLFEQSIPLTLINNTRRVHDSGPVERISRHKLQVFVIAASSSTQLKENLKDIKDSLWWNHLASFVLFNWPSVSENECSKAYEMLWAAWEFNLLNAKFMCLHRTTGLSIYTYNPYSKTAPDSWRLKKTNREKNEQSLFLFARRFHEDKRICQELDFDKTKELNGYEVRLTVVLRPGHWSIDFNKTGIDGYGGMFGNLAKIFCRALNGTCKAEARQNGPDMPLDVFNGVSDIAFLPRYQLTTINYTTTYPHWLSGLGVMTQHRGHLSQLSKINSVIDSTSRYGVCLVFLITLLFFKYFLHQSLMEAFLNNLRIACNGSILNLPLNQAPRIYLACLFMFALTILAIYQGKLASLLTKPVPLPNVDTLQDLIDSDHAIYGYKRFANFFNDPVFKGRYIKLEDGECVDIVLGNFLAACVGDRLFLIQEAVKNRLYLSSDAIRRDYWIHLIRQDWPLEKRVNIILGRLVEADLVRYWHMKDVQKTIDRFQYFEKLEKNQKFEIITLGELSFAFAILGIGLGFATAIFIVEVYASRVRLWIKNMLGHIHSCRKKKNK